MSELSVPVAVVVPCFNCAITIDRAVQSIIQQAIQPSEIILVNDCSTDGTRAILHGLQKTYGAIIRVIDLDQNSGPGIARNVGWDAAQFKYVAFLDADDSWHPEKIQLQYQWMIENPEFCMTGHASATISTAFCNNKNPVLKCEFVEVFAESLLLTNCFPTRSVMLKKDLAVRFKPGKRYAEDYLLWLRIVFTQGRCALLTPTLAYSYKPSFGVSGLSASLWKMQKGEISVFFDLYIDKLINTVEFLRYSAWSCVKFSRRLVIAAVRR